MIASSVETALRRGLFSPPSLTRPRPASFPIPYDVSSCRCPRRSSCRLGPGSRGVRHPGEQRPPSHPQHMGDVCNNQARVASKLYTAVVCDSTSHVHTLLRETNRVSWTTITSAGTPYQIALPYVNISGMCPLANPQTLSPKTQVYTTITSGGSTWTIPVTS
jgi:hypothetical protein